MCSKMRTKCIDKRHEGDGLHGGQSNQFQLEELEWLFTLTPRESWRFNRMFPATVNSDKGGS
jgi:hypothetical protein